MPQVRVLPPQPVRAGLSFYGDPTLRHEKKDGLRCKTFFRRQLRRAAQKNVQADASREQFRQARVCTRGQLRRTGTDRTAGDPFGRRYVENSFNLNCTRPCGFRGVLCLQKYRLSTQAVNEISRGVCIAHEAIAALRAWSYCRQPAVFGGAQCTRRSR